MTAPPPPPPVDPDAPPPHGLTTAERARLEAARGALPAHAAHPLAADATFLLGLVDRLAPPDLPPPPPWPVPPASTSPPSTEED